MPSNNEHLTKAELEDFEAQRDLAAELLQSVGEMNAGQVSIVTSSVIEARKKAGLSQQNSVQWERGPRLNLNGCCVERRGIT